MADPFLRRRTLVVTDWVAWRVFLTRWGISVASLASGVATLVVFRRGLPHVGWIVGFPVPHELLLALPYVLTLVALFTFVGRASAPAAIGRAYVRE